MEGGGMPMEGGMPPQGAMPPDMGMPQDMGMPMDMGMEGGMPMEGGFEEGMGDEVPSYATIIDIEPGTDVMLDVFGHELALPEEAFPFVPELGMTLVQAEVVSLESNTMVAQLMGVEAPVEIPTDDLGMDFNEGDLFWFPEPPPGPDMMEEEYDMRR
jgi:hypothetical protein